MRAKQQARAAVCVARGKAAKVVEVPQASGKGIRRACHAQRVVET